MRKESLQEAIQKFDYSERERQIAGLLQLREQFVNYFNESFIRQMRIDDYAIGKGAKDWHVFSYGIERTFHDLGSIVGATAIKFGIYYSANEKKYIWARRFGETKTRAFNQIKRCLIQLLECGRNGDINGIANNMLSSMVKGKILSLYYPEQYLNVFSDTHLDAFLVKLGLDTEELLISKPVFKRQCLVEFKNSDVTMKAWPMDKFSNFLYKTFPMDSSQDNLEDDEPDFFDGKVYYDVEEKTVEMDLLHKRMQKVIKEILEKEGYHRAYIEKGHVDIKAITNDGRWDYFEVKTYSAKESIRLALGQILEYVHYPNTKKAETMYIVGIEAPDEKDVQYLELLRNKYKLPVWYRWFSVSDNTLHDKK